MFADKGEEDYSASSLVNARELIHIFREEANISEMAAETLFHNTCSANRLTSDEGKNTGFSSC